MSAVKHIAIIGGGQLARMLAQVGGQHKLNFTFVLEPGASTDAIEGLGALAYLDSALSSAELYEKIGRPDVCTVESENVDKTLLEDLSKHCPVRPGAHVVEICQHRGREKSFINKLDIPVAPYKLSANVDELIEFAEQHGGEFILKSCSFGYDGKNQWPVDCADDLRALKASLPAHEFVLEEKIKFDTEVSLIAARGVDGEIRYFDLSENYHEKGVLLTAMPAELEADSKLSLMAQSYLKRILEALDYVGVMAMECFLVGDKLYINELAPRVHNSGHWTQKACASSQFDMHLRAIAGLPFADTSVTTLTAMLNLLGVKVEQADLGGENADVHWYDKDLRPGRKVGHINVAAANYTELRQRLSELRKRVYP